MPDPNPAASLGAPLVSQKEKNAVNRNLVALLDALAPERTIRRAEGPRLRIERHRTPAGAVLQAANAAVSLSWFPEPGENSPLGELHVLAWRGTVIRRGVPGRGEGAVVTAELVLRPLEQAFTDKVWVSKEGVTYDTDSLAKHCLALLESEIQRSSPPDTAPAEPTA